MSAAPHARPGLKDRDQDFCSTACATGTLMILSNFPLQIWTDHFSHDSPISSGWVSINSRAKVMA
jgi:hypothetical protein